MTALLSRVLEQSAKWGVGDPSGRDPGGVIGRRERSEKARVRERERERVKARVGECVIVLLRAGAPSGGSPGAVHEAGVGVPLPGMILVM
jgi:hypothetical protein